MKIGLIGHSHIVALLDAIDTDWRKQITDKELQSREGYSDAFAGYHDPAFHGIARLDYEGHEIVACVPGMASEKTLVRNSDNGSVSSLPLFDHFMRSMRDCELVLSCIQGNELGTQMYLKGQPAPDYKAALVRTFPPIVMLSQKFKRVVHLLPPPPAYDISAIELKESWAALLAKHGAASIETRLSVYRSYCQSLATALAPHNVECWNPPKAACINGFLREELTGGLMHGNAEYGRLVWQEVTQSANRLKLLSALRS